MNVTVVPEEAKSVPLLWSTSNDVIASVREGIVYANKQGKATITVKSEDGKHSAICEVTVIKKVQSITVSPTELILVIGEKKQIDAIVYPYDATNKIINWTSSENSIVSVDGGEVTALSGGNATITATANGTDISADCHVTVLVPVESVSLLRERYFLSYGGKTELQIIFYPENASNKNYKLESDPPDIIDIHGNNIIAKKSGTTTVTISTEDGNKTANTIVSVFGTGIKGGHPYADLGLSVNWATYNIGATLPQEWGNYYAWGETETKDEYTWDNYKFMQEGYADQDHITKYTQYDDHWSSSGIWYDENGVFIGDGKTQLDPEDDAAIVNWGGVWRMPTKNEQQELFDNCWFYRIGSDDIHGYVYTSKINGESIFFPFIKEPTSDSLGYNYFGDYWSSTLYYYPYYAHISRILYYSRDSTDDYTHVGWSFTFRYHGLCIRPVF